MNKAALITFLVSMVPVVELRGAIPYGVAAGLSVQQALLISIIGNFLPIPILILFTKKVFAWLRTMSAGLNHFVSKLEARADEKKEIVEKYAFWGLMILVAIPLPGTGGWTGALVAAMMDMKLRKALPAIFVGICVAGIIVSAQTFGVQALV